MQGPLLERLVATIRAEGPIGFGAYMHQALYDPDHGFYATGGAGRRRDFITSPEVGPLFGAVVARALDSWWRELGRPETFTFVEAGAGPGTLARTVLAASPDCADSLRYVAVEASESQRAMHPEAVISAAEMPRFVDVGVVFANELLDNLAFDLYQWDTTGGWSEVRVGCSDAADGLVEALAPTSLRPTRDPEPEDGTVRVPDQFGARRWLQSALGAVGRGRVVVLDYAVPSYPVDHRWLRTYRGHEHGYDPLDRPGSQDMTADVAVDQLATVSEPLSVRTQREWLIRHGIAELVEEGRRHWAEKAAAPDLAAFAARSRIGEADALLDPAGLGGFTVLEWVVAGSHA